MVQPGYTVQEATRSPAPQDRPAHPLVATEPAARNSQLAEAIAQGR
jgi:hypothetical protein